MSTEDTAPTKRTPTLTAKQARFCAEYVQDLNGTAAARRAGYSPGSARAIAGQLLAIPHVMAEVSRLEALQLKKAGITAEVILDQLRRIAMFDPADVYDQAGNLKHPKDWPTDARLSLASFDVVIRNTQAGDGIVDKVAKVKLSDRMAALEMLAKHLGLLTEKVDVNKTIRIEWMPQEPPPDVQVIEQDTPLSLSPGPDTPHPPTQNEMGSGAAPPGSPNRTHPPRFFESESENPTSSVSVGVPGPEELEWALNESGISRRQQERMFPELRKK